MSKFTGELWGAFIVVSLTAGTALAQSPDDQAQRDPVDPTSPTVQTTTDVAPTPAPPPPAPPTIVVVPPPAPAPAPAHRDAESGFSRSGFSLSFGGGVADFTDQTMREATGVGGTWALRATLGTKAPIGFEGSYIGSAQSISALGLDRDAMLVSNGLQGALRLNAVIGAPITPFVFGGVAWTRYDLANTSTTTAAISDQDDLIEIPVGLGIGGSWRGFGYDLRGELRFATREDMVREQNAGRDVGGSADMHRWGLNATLGYGF